ADRYSGASRGNEARHSSVTQPCEERRRCRTPDEVRCIEWLRLRDVDERREQAEGKLRPERGREGLRVEHAGVAYEQPTDVGDVAHGRDGTAEVLAASLQFAAEHAGNRPSRPTLGRPRGTGSSTTPPAGSMALSRSTGGSCRQRRLTQCGSLTERWRTIRPHRPCVGPRPALMTTPRP